MGAVAVVWASGEVTIPRVVLAAALRLVSLHSIFGSTGRRRRRAVPRQAQAATPQFFQQP